MVILAFTTILAFASAKTEALNKQVMADVAQISQALKIYHSENGFYPYGNGVPEGISNYLSRWPTPPANKKCKISNYNYSQTHSGDDFQMTFCFLASVQTITAKDLR